MNDVPWYKKEFPDFDRELPDVPDFEDDSWHNDICPKLARAVHSDLGSLEHDLVIWCDYADPARREYPDAKLYLLQDIRDWEDPVDLCSSDDIADINAAIAAFDRSR